MKGDRKMTRIEILMTGVTINEKSMINACKDYPVPETKEELNELEQLIKKVSQMKNELPHGMAWAGPRRLRAWCITVLEEKKEDYLLNQLTEK